MPQPNQKNENKFLSTLKDLSNKIKYVFNHKSVEEIYLLYVEGEFLRIIDEDFFTLLRIPEAINTGDSINHYDYNTVNHWISAHPKFVIPFLIAATTVGVARVIQVLSSTAVYPETIGEFLTLIRQDAKETNQEHTIEDDLDLLNRLCNELGLPYYYIKGTVKKQRRKLKADNRSFFAKLFIQPTPENSEVEYEPLVEETHDELILCKKDAPIKPVTEEEPQNKPKPNWFERTWHKIENSKFVEFVITPPWKAANRAAYVYWILWFGAVIVSAIMTGGLVLTATGTVTVTTAALSTVICVPAAVGLIFWGHELINKIWPKKKAAPEIELNDLQKKSPPNVVTNRSEKDSIFSLIGKALALKIHTKQQQDQLANNRQVLSSKIQSNNQTTDRGEEQSNRISEPSQAQDTDEKENKPFSTAKGRITWQSFYNFCSGYVISTFGVWFLTSAITAFALKFGAMAVATALSATVIGIPLSLLISFSVGVTAGGIFAISGATNSSVAQKEKEAFLMDHPELRPEKIAQQEAELKSLQQKLKTAHQKHIALVEQYNLLNQKITGSDQAQPNLVQPLPIHSKLNYRTLKNTNSAYTNTNQSKFSKVCDYVLTAIGNAGRMGYITRSLMIGGMITILAVTFLHPLGFLTGPIAIAVAVGISGIIFGAATVVDRYYEQQRAKEELNNLRLRLLELNEKNKLKNELNYQTHLVESHNKTLEEQIAQKQTMVDAQEKQLTSQSGEEQTSTFSFSNWKNWVFNSNNNSRTCKASVAFEQPTPITGLRTPVQCS